MSLTRNYLVVPFVVLTAACALDGNQPATSTVYSQAEIKAEVAKKPIIREVKNNIISLYNDDPVERAKAARRLAKLGPAAVQATPYLINRLSDDTPTTLSSYLGGGFHSNLNTTPGEEAAEALGNIGAEATGQLVEALKSPDANTRRLSVKALGQIGDISSIQPLIILLEDTDRGVKSAVSIALGQYHHPKAAIEIMHALPVTSLSVRVDLVYVLARIHDVIVVPDLIKQLPAEESEVRAAIVYTLGKLNDARALNTLLATLSDENDTVRANCAHALSNYYTHEVIAALISALDDPVSHVQEAASEALSILTGKAYGVQKQKWVTWWNMQQQKM